MFYMHVDSTVMLLHFNQWSPVHMQFLSLALSEFEFECA